MITRPISTPWGMSDDAPEDIGGGILHVTTPSHGGYWVPTHLYSQMPEALRNKFNEGTNWFEEDCEWALVSVAFPHLFNDDRFVGFGVRFIESQSKPDALYHAAYKWLHESEAGQKLLPHLTADASADFNHC